MVYNYIGMSIIVYRNDLQLLSAILSVFQDGSKEVNCRPIPFIARKVRVFCVHLRLMNLKALEGHASAYFLVELLKIGLGLFCKSFHRQIFLGQSSNECL